MRRDTAHVLVAHRQVSRQLWSGNTLRRGDYNAHAFKAHHRARSPQAGASSILKLRHGQKRDENVHALKLFASRKVRAAQDRDKRADRQSAKTL